MSWVQDFCLWLYPWTKALHIMAVISWMAGLFYLPRLFVYHAEKASPGSELAETLKVMEDRLLRVIMRPAMVAAWFFGALLLATPGVVDWASFWIWIKLAMVFGMTGFHVLLAAWCKDFAMNRNTRSGRAYRMWNEVPTLLMAVIVIAVVVRPF